MKSSGLGLGLEKSLVYT